VVIAVFAEEMLFGLNPFSSTPLAVIGVNGNADNR
jgi:hypothetical protein